MKRSWTTILLIAGLLGLLAILGALQYRWLKQINESVGEKERTRVSEQADRFAMDFNREIQNGYFNFQNDAEEWKNQDWTGFNERYDYWRGKTQYPDLISDFYFFRADSDAAPLRYSPTSRSFSPTEMTGDLADLRTKFTLETTFKRIYEDKFVLVLPIRKPGPRIDKIMIRGRTSDTETVIEPPETFGFLVIKLSETVITGKLLDSLVDKYFGDGDYRVGVLDSLGHRVFGSVDSGAIDATAPLLSLSADNFVFFANRDLTPPSDVAKKPANSQSFEIKARPHVENHSFTRVETDSGKKGVVQIEVQRDSAPRTSIFTEMSDKDSGRWTVQVQHSSGSIDAFLVNTLRRNLAIGFGILILLAGSVAAIIFSAHRSKVVARRQIDFVSSVSHEFRTPLAVIYSAGENLADGVTKEDSQVLRYGTLIKSEGRKLSSMVEQILDFAGARSGRKKYNFRGTSIADTIENALTECAPLIREQGITVESDVSLTLPTIQTDNYAVSQAVQNLIANAVKYNNGEKWVRVAAADEGGKIRISVEDRGIGISAKDLKHIFEPFFRSRTVVDAQIHGNGLGLSLVKQIAEAHGGRVLATSKVGSGSKFTIELPVG